LPFDATGLPWVRRHLPLLPIWPLTRGTLGSARSSARVCPVASRRMKTGAAPPSVKPTLLRAEDQEREPSVVVLHGPPPGTGETMLRRGEGRRRGYARYLPNQWETGDIRVDLSRTNAIQRLWETQGWTVFHLPSPRLVFETPSTPLAPRAPSAGRRPRRQAAPSSCVLTSAGRSCCCSWTTPKLCTSSPREGAVPAAPSAVLLPGMTMLATPSSFLCPGVASRWALGRPRFCAGAPRRVLLRHQRAEAVRGGPPSQKRARAGCMVVSVLTSPSKSARCSSP
jgi:hypothetical protein